MAMSRRDSIARLVVMDPCEVDIGVVGAEVDTNDWDLAPLDDKEDSICCTWERASVQTVLLMRSLMAGAIILRRRSQESPWDYDSVVALVNIRKFSWSVLDLFGG